MRSTSHPRAPAGCPERRGPLLSLRRGKQPLSGWTHLHPARTSTLPAALLQQHPPASACRISRGPTPAAGLLPHRPWSPSNICPDRSPDPYFSLGPTSPRPLPSRGPQSRSPYIRTPRALGTQDPSPFPMRDPGVCPLNTRGPAFCPLLHPAPAPGVRSDSRLTCLSFAQRLLQPIGAHILGVLGWVWVWEVVGGGAPATLLGPGRHGALGPGPTGPPAAPPAARGPVPPVGAGDTSVPAPPAIPHFSGGPQGAGLAPPVGGPQSWGRGGCRGGQAPGVSMAGGAARPPLPSPTLAGPPLPVPPPAGGV